MQKIGNKQNRHARPAGTASRSRRIGTRSLADSALERRLMAEFWRYSLDVPESAFPSFLESLHYDTLN